MKFTCIKTGKKLIWNQGVQVKTITQSPSVRPTQIPSNTPNPIPSKNTEVINPSPSPVKTIAYSIPSVPSLNIDSCKVKEVSTRRGFTGSGFPKIDTKVKSSGTLRWAIVPIDWVDLPGNANFMIKVREQMELASEWIDLASEGQAKIEWQIHNSWIRLPGSSKDYEMPLSSSPARQPAAEKFWKTAMNESDKFINYSGVQGVHFILPDGQQIMGEAVKGYPWEDAVKNYITNEGSTIDFFTVPGVFYDRADLGRAWWTHWVKEYTRSIGVAAIGAQRVESPYQTYTIHGNTDGERELNGWQRFLIDWLPEKKIYCQTIGNIKEVELTLVPLNEKSTDGIKMAIFTISETRALILESRRVTKFACTTPTKRNGVLAYVYDSTLGNGQDFFIPVVPANRPLETSSCANPLSADLMLREGDSANYESISITVTSHANLDKVKVSRS